jgi:hypothetical protein
MVFLDGALVSCARTSSLAGNKGVMAHFARTLIICSNHAPENVLFVVHFEVRQEKCQFHLINLFFL